MKELQGFFKTSLAVLTIYKDNKFNIKKWE